MIRLEHSEYLYALALIPLLVLLYWMMTRWRARSLRRFGDFELIKRLFPSVSRYRPLTKFTLLLLAFAATVVGVANPQIGSKLEEVKREGVDIMIALDVSNSMLAEDIRPDRLQRAKRAISKLVDNLYNDRIGIIVFAGEAFLQLPLTADYSAAKLFLSAVSTDVVPTQGTAIGSAIELAMKSFQTEEEKYKTLIIITDGENHEDDAIGKAREAAAQGAIIHTIGMGSPEGVPIPIYRNGQRSDFRKNRSGEVVMTKLDESMLQQLAAAGGGAYIRATTAETGLEQILDEINTMEKKEFGTRVFTDYEDRFQYLLGAAFVLLLIEFLINDRKGKLTESFNLFGEERT